MEHLVQFLTSDADGRCEQPHCAGQDFPDLLAHFFRHRATFGYDLRHRQIQTVHLVGRQLEGCSGCGYGLKRLLSLLHAEPGRLGGSKNGLCGLCGIKEGKAQSIRKFPDERKLFLSGLGAARDRLECGGGGIELQCGIK